MREDFGTVWTEPLSSIARLSLALILSGLVLRWLVDRDSDATIAEFGEMVQVIASKAVVAPRVRTAILDILRPGLVIN